jgi:hypothetical protein
VRSARSLHLVAIVELRIVSHEPIITAGRLAPSIRLFVSMSEMGMFRRPTLGTSETSYTGGVCPLVQNIFSSCAICRMSAYSWSLAATNFVARRISKTV